MKKKVFLLLLKNVGISLLVLALIIGTGVAAFFISHKYYSKKAEVEADVEVLTEYTDILSQVKTDVITKNMIYAVDENNNIKAIMLEICNTETYNMDYITIPVKTSYTIPATMYQKLMSISEELPQVVMLSKLRKYMPEDQEDEKAFGYITVILEKMLGIEASYFTVYDSETFAERYYKQRAIIKYRNAKDAKVAEKEAEEDSSESDTTPAPGTTETTESADRPKVRSVSMAIFVINDDHKEELKEVMDDKEEIMKYIQEEYKQEGFASNLTVANKIGYAEAYVNMNPDYYHFWGMPAKRRAGVFTIKPVTSQKLIQKLMKNTVAYSEPQFDDSIDTSKKITISEKFLTGGIYTEDKELAESIKADREEDDDSTSTSASTSATPKPTKAASSVADKVSIDKKIVILNATGVSGVAAETKSVMTDDGYLVGEIGDYTGNEAVENTRIIVREEGIGEDLLVYFSDAKIEVGTPEGDYDIEIVIGTNDA
ncbi:MAG TPA: hypothetical protein DCP07_07475 [Lachnospiraceae bacterium]|nr:hypothetical protein [Lachnospiraceae bacterium]